MTSSTPSAVGRRLRATRVALGYERQSEFYAEIGVPANTANQWEMGRSRINLDAASALKRRFNLTLDWIYLGDPQHLTKQLADRIDTALAVHDILIIQKTE